MKKLLTLREEIAVLLSTKGKMEKEQIIDAVFEGKDKKPPRSSVAGRLSEMVSAGVLVKEGKGSKAVYSLKDASFVASLVGEGTAVGTGDSVSVAEEVVELPPRVFTEEEELLVDVAKKKYGHVKLEAEHKVIAQQLKDRMVRNLLFIGDPGSGKTTIARAIGVELNRPVRSQNFSANSEEVQIIGGFVPDEEKEGTFKWVDGEFTRAFRNGDIYIAEEINYAKPGVLGVLNNALDDVGVIRLDNGDVIKRHPDFVFVSCLNVGLAGTQRMNLALINRMQKVMKFDAMKKDKMVKIVADASGYKNTAVIRKMVEVHDMIREKIKKEQIDMAVISIRNLINWAIDIRSTGDILKSAYPTVVWAVCMDDEDTQKEIYDDIIVPRLRGQSA